MVESISSLENEYCPPLDTPLFYAIISDYDISNEKSIKEARLILDDLKASAEAEENTNFDPSGSGTTQDAESINHGSQKQAFSASDDRLTRSDSTELTSLAASQRSSRLGSNDSSQEPSSQVYDYGIEGLPTSEKIAILVESFPDLSPFGIKHTLSQCGNNVEKAIDDLLTQNLFKDAYDSEGERQVIPKGVDGFAQNNTHRRKRKGNSKKLRLNHIERSGSSSSTQVSTPQPVHTPNQWTVQQQDVEFIAEHTKLSSKAITSAYHKSSGSFRQTIIKLGEASIEKTGVGVENEDPIIQINMAELANEFPSLSPDVCRGIVKLAHPSTASAHSLAKEFLSRSVSNLTSHSGVPITAQYARLALNNDGAESSPAMQGSKKAKQPLNIDREEARSRANDFREARTAAFAKATAAYRKSKSHPLMGGAAAYYASLGHDAGASIQKYSEAEADAIVSQQSSATHVDLHNLDVNNAVRVTKEKVQGWWESGHAEWAAQRKLGESESFKIITGAGRHSSGGKAKIGPAVRKALVQDGWRIDEASGLILVTGRARR